MENYKSIRVKVGTYQKLFTIKSEMLNISFDKKEYENPDFDKVINYLLEKTKQRGRENE